MKQGIFLGNKLIVNEFNVFDYWYKCLVESDYTTSYKFALALSIIEILKKNRGRIKETFFISRKDILAEWARYYWDHTIVYKLKESTSNTKPPQFVGVVNEYVQENANLDGHMWKHLEESDQENLINLYFKLKLKLDNPLSRFQAGYSPKNTNGDREGKGDLFNWDESGIYIHAQVAEIIMTHHTLFSNVAILGWATFLEANNTVPGLIKKTGLEEPKREHQRLWALMKSYADIVNPSQCLYCGKNSDITVDHVIPFSYVFSDEIINLAPACGSCNASKNDRLPPDEFIIRLLERNNKIFEVAKLKKDKELIKELPFNSAKEVEDHFRFLERQCEAAGFLKWSGPY